MPLFSEVVSPPSGTGAAALSCVDNKPEDDSLANAQEEAEATTRLAREHGVSVDAVSPVCHALRRGGGTTPTSGDVAMVLRMTMAGDMFNESLKAKLNAIADELSRHLREHPVGHPDADRVVSYRSGGTRHAGSLWPEELGNPSSVGSQNEMRYAVFPVKGRPFANDRGQITTYDTGDHQISGVSQAQSTDSSLTFVSQQGDVRVSDLARADSSEPGRS